MLPAKYRPQFKQAGLTYQSFLQSMMAQSYPNPIPLLPRSSPYTQVFFAPPRISGNQMQRAMRQQMRHLTTQPGAVMHYNPTRGLRGRLFGDTLEKFMEEQRPALRSVIYDDSTHQEVSIRYGWQHDRDWFKVSCRCSKCDRAWSTTVTAVAMQRMWATTSSDEEVQRAFVRDYLAPLTETICLDDCFGLRERALLAEWLTERLRTVGARGMPYAQVVHEAVAAELCTPRDVDQTLRDLDFVADWVKLGQAGIILPGGWDGEWSLPILYLPQGHPHRDW